LRVERLIRRIDPRISVVSVAQLVGMTDRHEKAPGYSQKTRSQRGGFLEKFAAYDLQR
jgi:hypothetical protein